MTEQHAAIWVASDITARPEFQASLGGTAVLPAMRDHSSVARRVNLRSVCDAALPFEKITGAYAQSSVHLQSAGIGRLRDHAPGAQRCFRLRRGPDATNGPPQEARSAESACVAGACGGGLKGIIAAAAERSSAVMARTWPKVRRTEGGAMCREGTPTRLSSLRWRCRPHRPCELIQPRAAPPTRTARLRTGAYIDV